MTSHDIPDDVGPTFITTPRGDELVIMTRSHYDGLVEAGSAVPGSETAAELAGDADVAEELADILSARQSRDAWRAAGRPTIPLAVVRRVRAGDSYLKAFRALPGMTQVDLAKAAGIGQSTLSALEAGKAPSAAARAALAAVLGVHPMLLSEDVPKPDRKNDTT